MTSIARLDQVKVSLGGQTILSDLDFDLAPGEVAGVVGPNGSGKTTFIRVLATLIRVDQGSGAVLGADLSTNDVYDVRRSIGLMTHTPALLPRLSLRENLDHACRLSGVDTDRVDGALHTVGLEEVSGRLAEASSFGMKRRLEVARLLLTGPRLLLLDEAASGLDSAARELISALIDRIVTRAGAVVLVSHDRAQLDETCQIVSHLSLGRLEPAS